MSLKNRKERNKYIREWKRERNKRLGKFGQRGKFPRIKQTEEEKKISKENHRKWEKGWRLKYFEEKPEKRLLWAATKRAKEKGLEINITEEDIKVPKKCPYLDIPLALHRARGDSRRDIASLDRLDNSKGYIKGNIEVISWLANSMKQNASKEDLIRFAKEILRRYES